MAKFHSKRLCIAAGDPHTISQRYPPIDRREFKGQMNRGKQDREPLRGKSASERVSEDFRGF